MFRNRKGYFSINIQTVTNARLMITDIVARWYGSAHDSTIFNNSTIRAQFENGPIPFSHLLGDKSEAIPTDTAVNSIQWARTTFQPQSRFNTEHSRASVWCLEATVPSTEAWDARQCWEGTCGHGSHICAGRGVNAVVMRKSWFKAPASSSGRRGEKPYFRFSPPARIAWTRKSGPAFI